jgi:hypothetical protein
MVPNQACRLDQNPRAGLEAEWRWGHQMCTGRATNAWLRFAGTIEAVSTSHALPSGAGSTPSGGSMWKKKLPLLGTILAVGLAFYLLLIAFAGAEIGNKVNYPEGLEAVDPIPAAQTVPAQTIIRADLEFGYEGALILNGREIPADQTKLELSTGLLTFTPASGNDYALLPGSVVRMTVEYWPRNGTRKADGQAFSWSFTVS